MAKLKDLKVTIGLSKAGLTKLNKDLRSVKGNFRRNFGEIQGMVQSAGRGLTMGLTAPLAGLGAAAVKSAVDLEKLETSFISLTGGAKQAADMMANLNEFTAKTPFQIEGVATAARQLIASGTGVEQVNEQLQFLGDIAATSGGNIEDIAAIVAKVNAKGKVELENLNQLAERGIPIFTALAEATGLPADELGAGAVSVDQFNKTLSSFAEEGGFAAGAMERLSETAAGKFSTALDNLKLAGAELAESLMPTIKAVIDRVTSLAQGFAALSDRTKSIILVVGGLAAAAGPLLLTVDALMKARTAMLALNLVMAANPLGAVVAGVTLLIGAMAALKGSIKTTREETEDFIIRTKELDKEQAILALNTKRRALETEMAQLQQAKAAEEAAARAGSLGDKFDKQIASGNVSRYAEQIADTAEAIKQLKMATAEAQFGEGAVVSLSGLPDRATTEEQGSAVVRNLEAVAQVQGKAATQVENHALKNRGLKVSYDNLGQSLEPVIGRFRQLGMFVKDQLPAFFEGAFQALSQGTKSFGEFMLQTLQRLLIKATALVATFAVLSVLMGGATGVAELTGGKAGLKFFMGAGMGIPQMADGGLFSGASLAMVGEGPGTSAINPEVVAPLDKLQQMMGGGNVTVTGRLDGRDILISSERAGFDRNRVRGF